PLAGFRRSRLRGPFHPGRWQRQDDLGRGEHQPGFRGRRRDELTSVLQDRRNQRSCRPSRLLRSKQKLGRNNFMKTLINNFVRDEQGQDLIEYTLLLAFVCLASAALFISAGGSVAGIWNATNSRLTAANTSAGI